MRRSDSTTRRNTAHVEMSARRTATRTASVTTSPTDKPARVQEHSASRRPCQARTGARERPTHTWRSYRRSRRGCPARRAGRCAHTAQPAAPRRSGSAHAIRTALCGFCTRNGSREQIWRTHTRACTHARTTRAMANCDPFSALCPVYPLVSEGALTSVRGGRRRPSSSIDSHAPVGTTIKVWARARTHVPQQRRTHGATRTRSSLAHYTRVHLMEHVVWVQCAHHAS